MRIVLPLAAAVLLAACSSPSTPPSAPSPAPQAATSAHHVKTPWDGLVKDENKAKAVQGIVDKQAKAQQKAIEKQSQ